MQWQRYSERGHRATKEVRARSLGRLDNAPTFGMTLSLITPGRQNENGRRRSFRPFSSQGYDNIYEAKASSACRF